LGDLHHCGPAFRKCRSDQLNFLHSERGPRLPALVATFHYKRVTEELS
jgi:hypothetical protein